MFQDREIRCAECGDNFTFTADDQQFHADKGYTDPRRCPSCRRARRANSGGGGGGYGGGGFGRGDREMHSATCAQCGREAQVPFVPRGDRPVYCSDCFNAQRSGGGRGGRY